MKVIVEADGGSRGNPGPAGYGTVVWSTDHGAVLAESKQAIGRANQHVAEYRGLIAGTREAAKLRRHRRRRVDGLQACGGTDVGSLEGQTSRYRRTASTGHRVVTRFGHITYLGSRGPRTATPTAWPTRRWTPAAEIETPAEAQKERRRHHQLRHPRVGPGARWRANPVSCYCATDRPSCRRSGGIPAAVTRR